MNQEDKDAVRIIVREEIEGRAWEALALIAENCYVQNPMTGVTRKCTSAAELAAWARSGFAWDFKP